MFSDLLIRILCDRSVRSTTRRVGLASHSLRPPRFAPNSSSSTLIATRYTHFSLTAKSPPLVAPHILRPKTRGSPKSRRATSQARATSISPLLTRSTRRSRSLASRDSVWTTIRKGFYCHSGLSSYVSLFPLSLDHPLSLPQFSLLPSPPLSSTRPTSCT